MLQQDSHKQHISAQFNAELEAVKNHLLEMGGKVEQQVANAVASLLNAPAGERPVRTVVDELGMKEPIEGINAAAEGALQGIYAAFEMADMLNTKR